MDPGYETVRRYIEGQRLLFISEQCLNLTKKSLDPILRAHGLNHSQYLVLLVLGYADMTGERVIGTELAYLLGREKHSITPIVESLVRAGCIERGGDPEDRRIITLKLTPRGKELVGTVRPQTMRTIADIPFGSSEETGSMFRNLEAARRAIAARADQNPDLYSSTFERLLLEGERRLLERAEATRKTEDDRCPT